MTLDFWANLCDVEVANRHPFLRHDAFIEIVKAVIFQSTFDLDELYGSNFTSWADYCEPLQPNGSQKSKTKDKDWSEERYKFGPDSARREDGRAP